MPPPDKSLHLQVKAPHNQAAVDDAVSVLKKEQQEEEQERLQAEGDIHAALMVVPQVRPRVVPVAVDLLPLLAVS